MTAELAECSLASYVCIVCIRTRSPCIEKVWVLSEDGHSTFLTLELHSHKTVSKFRKCSFDGIEQ
jgi:hypothetical protein